MVIFCFGAAAGIVSGLFQRKIVDGNVVIELHPGGIMFKRHLVNMLVGIIGAFAFVPFGARVLDLEFIHIFGSGSLENTFKCLLFLMSLATIGGFAGYRALSVVTDKMLAKVNELDERTRGLEAANSEIEKANKGLDEKAKDLDEMAKREAAIDRAVYAYIVRDLDIEAAATAIKKSLSIYETKYGAFVNGMVLRRKKSFAEAIAAIDRGLTLPPDEFCPTDASLYWNKACYLALLDPTNLTDIIGNLDRSIQIKPNYRGDISTETDLRGVIDNPVFLQHFSPLSNSTT